MKGANVIFQDVHVSGHACQEEIKLIYSLVKPKYAIPVHGEYRHLMAQASMWQKSLVFPKKISLSFLPAMFWNWMKNSAAGDRITYRQEHILVDGLGVGDVGNIVLRDRQHLAEDGIMIVVMTLERSQQCVLAGPDIVSRGFVYVRESEDLMEHAKEVVEDALESCLEQRYHRLGQDQKRSKRCTERLPVETYKEKSDDPADYYGGIKWTQ